MILTAVPEILVANSVDGALGAIVSGQAAVAALTTAFVDLLPAASTASTPSACVTPHESPEKTNAVEDGEPTATPSRYTPYDATATLSTDAVHEMDNCVAVTCVTASWVGVLGGCVSAVVTLGLEGGGGVEPAGDVVLVDEGDIELEAVEEEVVVVEVVVLDDG